MKIIKVNIGLLILSIFFGLSSKVTAQISAPGRSWAGLTQYINQANTQDSIFVVFSSTTNPKKGALKAKFSDGSASNFTWYKYKNTIVNPSNRFELLSSQNNVTESNLINLDKGGYKVMVTRLSDNVTETYTCWVMIDDVSITGITVNNQCDYLYLDATVFPSKYTVIYDYFTYWDITRANHPEINKLGSDYFKSLTWTASNNQIGVLSSTTLSLLIEDPNAPLYDSKYSVKVQNPFGRSLTSETPMIVAKATKADFLIYVDKDGVWDKGGTDISGEAPLKLKLESTSTNADSIYWRVINDEKLFLKGADSLVWRDSALFGSRIESYPTPEKLISGNYPIEHISVKLSSGCRDTMKIIVLVDSSMIKSDAIPNVFTPNGDNTNDYFKLKEPKTNVQSIKSFHVVILSRWGNLVYEYYGDPKEWKGWNGLIHGDKAEAPEGVYYFMIEATGWDSRQYKGGIYKGFLHLFRGK